jgi:hypothetical protein
MRVCGGEALVYLLRAGAEEGRSFAKEKPTRPKTEGLMSHQSSDVDKAQAIPEIPTIPGRVNTKHGTLLG